MIANDTDRSQMAPEAHRPDQDQGSILIFVLVAVAICSLIALPMLSYATTVIKAGEVQSNRTQAVELASGGTWVAMENELDLYDFCDGTRSTGLGTVSPGVYRLPSSLPGVSTVCEVLDQEQLRPPTEMPFHVATVQADRTLPTEFATADTYTNPNTGGAGSANWLTTPDWTPAPESGKVWLPQLPVRSTSVSSPVCTPTSTSCRDTELIPGFAAPGYSECRVFFPGTFDDPITIDGPAYFTSGVYYFTEEITLQDDADVVVGNGAENGCTTDFEAISGAVSVPDPLNMSGLGGTFVLGGDARISVDDDGSGAIRFVINQRYVAESETSVAASSDVAIVSVNGQHEPFLPATGPNPAEVAGDDFIVSGSIHVPASTIGTDGDPSAVSTGYLPSTLTVKPGVPDAPTIPSVRPYQIRETNSSTQNDGIFVISWNKPNENGSLIESYTAVDANDNSLCTVSVPPGSGLTVPTSCVIYPVNHQNLNDHDDRPEITVTATNGYGESDPSPVSAYDSNTQDPRMDLVNADQAVELPKPNAPVNVSTGTSYSDGLEITWEIPDDTDRAPITGFTVSAQQRVLVGAPPPPIECTARFDETSCVVGLDPLALLGYDISVTTHADHSFASAPSPRGDLNNSDPTTISSPIIFVAGGSPYQPPPPNVAGPVLPTPILDFTTTAGSEMEIIIDGYVSVPQGRILVTASDQSVASFVISGGVVAGHIDVDASTAPGNTQIFFDNPVAQKRVRIRSTSSGNATASSEAIIQVNRSGSLAINSWIVQ